MNIIQDLQINLLLTKDIIIINKKEPSCDKTLSIFLAKYFLNKKYYKNIKNYYLKRKEPSFDKILLILLDCSIS